jgi:predicted nucleic acid-binding protein
MPDVISNTTPLQYLHQLGCLDFLYQLYQQVIVPQAVYLRSHVRAKILSLAGESPRGKP